MLADLLKKKENLEKIRNVLKDFYDHVFLDTMIGFYFKDKNKTHLIEKEYELTLNALGGTVSYTGRPLSSVHMPLKIAGGHFDRRLEILKNTLKAHDLPQEISRSWIEHTIKLRSLITGDKPGECQQEGV